MTADDGPLLRFALSPNRVGIAALALLFLAGCQTPVEKTQGQVTVEILEPQNSPPPTSKEKTEFEVQYIPGYAKRDLTKPIYPSRALAAHAGTYVVYATVMIDDSGRVTGVSRSLRGIALPNPYSEDFFQAVREAVASWHFSPSHNVHWQRQPGGEMKYLRTEALSETMDVKFTFEASGVVK